MRTLLISTRSLLVLLLFGMLPQLVLAVNLEPRAKTNINKTTNLLKESLGNYDEEKGKLEIDKTKAINSLVHGSTVAKDLTEITGKNTSEIRSKANELGSIHAAELSSIGRKQMIKEKTITSLHVDYSKPLNSAYLRDAERIGVAQDKLFDNLLGKLKDIGVDCKSVKGNKLASPIYRLQVKKAHKKELDYNQTLCQELRGKYKCRDVLTLTCTKKGKKWGKWQNRQIKVSYSELPDNHQKFRSGYHIPSSWWSYRKVDSGAKTVRYENSSGHRRHGTFTRAVTVPLYNHYFTLKNNHTVLSQIRQIIIQKTKILSNQIQIPNQNIVYVIGPYWKQRSRNIEKIYQKGQWFFLPSLKDILIIFHYKYRDGTDICTNWQEGWEQQCQIQ